MAKAVNTYKLTVDYYKYPKHRTAGGYDVAAKSPEEAVEILQNAIGFGSVQVLYGCTKDSEYDHILKGKAAKLCGTRKIRMYHAKDPGSLLPYGALERVGGSDIKHECDPVGEELVSVETTPKRSLHYGHDRYKELV